MGRQPLTATRPASQAEAVQNAHGKWRTVVWDDPINTMVYVTSVFQRHFGYPFERAHNLMLRVHHQGRAVVSEGMKERMEADVLAMHSYGLRATLERSENTE